MTPPPSKSEADSDVVDPRDQTAWSMGAIAPILHVGGGPMASWPPYAVIVSETCRRSDARWFPRPPPPPPPRRRQRAQRLGLDRHRTGAALRLWTKELFVELAHRRITFGRLHLQYVPNATDGCATSLFFLIAASISSSMLRGTLAELVVLDAIRSLAASRAPSPAPCTPWTRAQHPPSCPHDSSRRSALAGQTDSAVTRSGRDPLETVAAIRRCLDVCANVMYRAPRS